MGAAKVGEAEVGGVGRSASGWEGAEEPAWNKGAERGAPLASQKEADSGDTPPIPVVHAGPEQGAPMRMLTRSAKARAGASGGDAGRSVSRRATRSPDRLWCARQACSRSGPANRGEGKIQSIQPIQSHRCIIWQELKREADPYPMGSQQVHTQQVHTQQVHTMLDVAQSRLPLELLAVHQHGRQCSDRGCQVA